MIFREELQQAAQAFGIVLTGEQLASFQTYYELLVEWNEKMNLTAITDPREVAVKHIIDSLSCLDTGLLPTGCRLIDVGTGAGFPGLPLKIVRPDIRLTLLDSLNKRLTFLRTVAEALSLQEVALIHGRAEETARTKEHRGRYDVATARAVARLNVLCELCLPFVKPDGYFLAQKGAQYQEELAEAANALKVLGARAEKTVPVKLPGLEDIRAVICIRKDGATPSAYPRKAGTPEKKPL